MDPCNSKSFTDNLGLIPPKAYAENSGKKNNRFTLSPS